MTDACQAVLKNKTKTENRETMNAIQMNAELFRQLSVIAEDEGLMAKLLRYARRLTSTKPDPTLMTKQEFFANVDEALEQAKQGRVHRMQPSESLDDFLNRMGR